MAASQRERTPVAAQQRSFLPTVPGIPTGAAVAVAVACTFLGYLIDVFTGGGELTSSFATLYVVGCLAAVLAVRFHGLFATMVLPPLLLFIAVPLAYQQLSDNPSTSIKDILLNLAIPLVHRFPTMMLATMLVLLAGAARIVMYRREQDADRSDAARRGSSWGRNSSKKPQPERGRGKGERTPASARRRPKRREPDDYEDTGEPADIDVPPRRGGRRRPAPPAEKPQRAGGGTATRSRDPRTRVPRNGNGQPQRSEPRPAQQQQQRRGGNSRPQPIVRYRDRETGRAER